jgi:dTMP kinase
MPQATTTTARNAQGGVLISFEGLDGVGKTTQIALLEQALRQAGREVLRLREPGATRLGEAVRSILLDKADLEISPMAEMLLFEAARAQLVEEVVRPALERGCVVVCDRFYDSTLAYQGFGRGLGREAVAQANALACGQVRPDRTILLDMDEAQAHERACAQGADRMEREAAEFHARVKQGFLWAAGAEPGRVRRVDASGTPLEVWARIRAELLDLVDLPETPSQAPGAER